MCCRPHPNQLKVSHINHLKNWYGPDLTTPTVAWSDIHLPPLSAGELPWATSNTEALGKNVPPLAPELTPQQKQQLVKLPAEFTTLFSATPGQTTVIWHVIETPPGACGANHPSPSSVKTLRHNKPVGYQYATNGRNRTILQRSEKPYCFGPQTGQHWYQHWYQFGINFRVVNKITVFDAYPMPRTIVLLSQLGKTRYVTSALGLTKGCWQVPL